MVIGEGNAKPTLGVVLDLRHLQHLRALLVGHGSVAIVAVWLHYVDPDG